MNVFQLTDSPFDKTKPVQVRGGKGPYANTVEALSHFDLSPVAGKRVLLKPNAGRVAGPDSGIVTNPQVVAAAIDVFRSAGADVSIGESPITGVKTMEAFEASGIAEVARLRDCPLIDMDERPALKVALPEGQAIQDLKLCADMADFDFVVSLAVMKMHMHTGATLAIKNMKGCLWRRSKVLLHMLPPVPDVDVKPINVAIADMSWALRPHFSVVEGTVGMEGLGPSAGSPKKGDVVVAGVDPFAVDAVACQIMGIRAEDIPHLAIGAGRGYGVIDMDRIAVEPANWRERITPFEPPPSVLDIDFPNVKILDENSCSACQSTLMLFLKRYGERLLDYFPENDEVHVAIGKGHDDVPKNTLCIGNCIAKHKKKGIFVKGCPPVGSEILSAIAGRPTLPEDEANPPR